MKIVCFSSSPAQYESGVHRVLRVPKTDPQKRMHTSTAAVLILPMPSVVSGGDVWHLLEGTGREGRGLVLWRKQCVDVLVVWGVCESWQLDRWD